MCDVYRLFNYSIRNLTVIDKEEINGFMNFRDAYKKIVTNNSGQFKNIFKNINNLTEYQVFIQGINEDHCLITYLLRYEGYNKDLIKYLIEKDKTNVKILTNDEILEIGAYICSNYDCDMIDMWIKLNPLLKDSTLKYTTLDESFYTINKTIRKLNDYSFIDSKKLTEVNLCYACLFNQTKGLDIIIYLCKNYNYCFWKSINMLPWSSSYDITFKDLQIFFEDYDKFNNLIEIDPFKGNYKNIDTSLISYIVESNDNFAEKMIKPVRNKVFTDIYIESICLNFKLNKVKKYLNQLNIDEDDFKDHYSNLFNSICKDLITKYPKSDKKRKLKIAILRVIFQYIQKNFNYYANDYYARDYYFFSNLFEPNCYGTCYMNALAASKYSKRIFKLLEKYNLTLNSIDESNYIPLLDSSKYGDFNTFKYLLKKASDEDLSTKSSCHNKYNLLSASCLNGDSRILKHICLKMSEKHRNIFKDQANDSVTLITNNYFPDNNISIKKSKYFLERYNLIYSKYSNELAISNLFTKTNDVYILNSVLNIHKNNLTIDFSDCRNYDLVKTLDIPFLKRIVSIIKTQKDAQKQYLNLLCILIYNNQFIDSKEIKYLLPLIKEDKYEDDILQELFKIINYRSISFPDKNTFVEKYDKTLKFFISKGFNINSKCVDRELCDLCDYERKFASEDIINILILNGFNLFDKYLFSERWPRSKKLLYSNNLIIKWCKSLRLLKVMIKKKYKKYLDCHKSDVMMLNQEILFYPNFEGSSLYKNLGKDFKNTMNIFNNDLLEDTKKELKPRAPPSHATPINLYNFMNKDNILTQKIDGKTQRGLKNIKFYPDLKDICFKFGVCLDSIEAEYVESENMYYIIDTYNDDIDIYNFNLYLRKYHDFIETNEKKKLFNKDNFIKNMKEEEILKTKYKYTALEYLERQNFDYDKGCALWWPKKMWMAKKGSYFLEEMNNIINLEVPIYPTDGWIVTNIESRESIKVKPDKYITVDLVKKQNKWYSKTEEITNVKEHNNIKYLENTIYRCYFDEESLSWIPKDLRTDKKKPNDHKIYLELNRYFLKPWNILDLIELLSSNSPYYQKNNYIIDNKLMSKKKEEFKNIKNNWLTRLKNKNILDLGCGFKNKTLLKNIDYDKYIGLDLDFDVFTEKTEKTENIKIKKYLINFTENWNNNRNSVIQYYNDFERTFVDSIYCINAIHFSAKNRESWNNFIEQLTEVSQSKTRLFINFLDRDLLDKVICKQINYKLSYVKKYLGTVNCEVTDFWIKIYYDWCHINPSLEPVLNFKIISESFEKLGWYVVDFKQNEISFDSPWDNYMNCFSKLILEYK